MWQRQDQKIQKKRTIRNSKSLRMLYRVSSWGLSRKSFSVQIYWPLVSYKRAQLNLQNYSDKEGMSSRIRRFPWSFHSSWEAQLFQRLQRINKRSNQPRKISKRNPGFPDKNLIPSNRPHARIRKRFRERNKRRRDRRFRRRSKNWRRAAFSLLGTFVFRADQKSCQEAYQRKKPIYIFITTD